MLKLADARRIIGENGVRREALKALSERLVELAAQRTKFDATDFPPPQPGSGETAYVSSVWQREASNA